MNDYARLKNEMHQMVREKETIGRDIQNKMRQIQILENKVPAAAITAQTEGLMARNQTQALANRNMQLHQESRISDSILSSYTQRATKRDYYQHSKQQSECEQRLRTLSHQLGQLEHELGRVMDEKSHD